MKSLFPLATIALFGVSATFGQVAPVPLNQSPSRIVGHPQTEVFNIVSANPNLVEGRELLLPFGLALDTSVSPPILYVSDTGNNRILAWRNALTFRNGQPADIVIGQPDLYTTLAGGPPNSSARLSHPSGLAVYNGDLYVADSGNNRYMRFRKPFDNIGNELPDLFIGQPNSNGRNPNYNGAVDRFGIGLASGNTVNEGSLAFDSAGNLWVTDPLNRRVLQFAATDVASGGGGKQATLELGQLDFGSPGAIPNASTRTDAKTLGGPNMIAINPESGRLFVGDSTGTNGINRVLVFTPPFSNAMAASRIMGIGAGTTGSGPCAGISSQDACDKTAMVVPEGIFLIPGGKVGVVDSASHRILIFDSVDRWPDPNVTLSPLATGVAGQPDFHNRGANGVSLGYNTAATASSFYSPNAAVFFGNELYVVDGFDHRVVVLPYSDGSFGAATRVLGQDSFTTKAPNLIEGREFNFVGASPGDAGIAIDSTGDTPHLYVSDPYNNRVLGFRDARRVQAGQKADLVLGQADFTTALCNFQGANNLDTGSPDKPTQSSLCGPMGLLLDAAGNLYVADAGNSRVLRFPAPFAHLGPLQQADLVLGQRNFTAKISDATATTMSFPYGLAFAGDTGLLVSDPAHNRVLLFPFSPGGSFNPGTDNGKAATKVFGQTDFNSVARSNTDSTMNAPHHIATDGEAHIYVADTGNNRIMIFDQVNSNPSTGAPAAKILTLTSARAVFINQTTGELYAGDNTTLVKKYPQFSTLLLNPTSTTAVASSYQVLAMTMDGFGNLAIADGSNRVSFYFPGLQVYNGANFSISARLAPGAFASICSPLSACDPTKRQKYFGSIEASNGGLPNPIPYPVDLGDVQIFFNGTPTPMTYVSSSQINFVIPMSAPTSGTADIAVVQTSTGRIYSAGQVGMAPYSPGLFTTEFTGQRRQAAAVNQSGKVNTTTECAPTGTYVSLYATGQGFVPNAPPDGSLPQGLVVPPLVARVAIGSNYTDTLTLEAGEPSKDQLVLSALSPEFPGVWQINVYIPKQTTPGVQIPVGISAGAFLSNNVQESGYITTICVRQP